MTFSSVMVVVVCLINNVCIYTYIVSILPSLPPSHPLSLPSLSPLSLPHNSYASGNPLLTWYLPLSTTNLFVLST